MTQLYRIEKWDGEAVADQGLKRRRCRARTVSGSASGVHPSDQLCDLIGIPITHAEAVSILLL